MATPAARILNFPGLIQPEPPREVTLGDLVQSFHRRNPFVSFYTHVPEWEEHERTQGPMPAIEHKCPACSRKPKAGAFIVAFSGQAAKPEGVVCYTCWDAVMRVSA